MDRRKFQGIITSEKADKTITVRVDRLLVHPKYKKRHTSSKKYAVHDPENKAHAGDMVTFKETRPMSKTKKWTLVSIDKHTQ